MNRSIVGMACAALLCASPLQAAEGKLTVIDVIEGLARKGWLLPYMLGVAEGHNIDASTKYLICLPAKNTKDIEKSMLNYLAKQRWASEMPANITAEILIGAMVHLYPCRNKSRP